MKMKSKNQKIFVIIATGLVVVGAYYSINSDTLFGKFLDQFSPVNWDEVRERDIIKNSIPIILLETKNGDCKVHGEKFDLIIDHQYFIRSNELVQKLQYDREEKTLIIPCDELAGEKSRLNVWYMLEESTNHPTKYEYFITEWEETPRAQN
jgi:hypothetical protein